VVCLIYARSVCTTASVYFPSACQSLLSSNIQVALPTLATQHCVLVLHHKGLAPALRLLTTAGCGLGTRSHHTFLHHSASS